MARDTLFQRDVEIEVESLDKKGSFFGTLHYGGKKINFGEQLIEAGLAKSFLMGGRPIPFMEDYEIAQDKAKANERGIWKKGFKMYGSPSKSAAEPFAQVEVLDVHDATRIYVRILKGSNLEKIDSAMAAFKPEDADELERPIRKGTIIAARFESDKKWYRAKFLRNAGKGNSEVQFIDYGNIASTPSTDLRQLPQNLQQFAPEAKSASFAYIKAPFLEKPCGKEAAKYLDTEILNKQMDAYIEYQHGELLFCVFCLKGDKSWDNSINAYLLAEGLAMIDQRQDLPQDADSWHDFQEDAKAEGLGIWQFGGTVSDSD